MAVKSETLDSHLESHKTENLDSKKSTLLALGVPEHLVNSFHDRLMDTLKQNPEVEDFALGEVEKAIMGISQASQKYERKFKSIMDLAFNNPDYNPDESLVA